VEKTSGSGARFSTRLETRCGSSPQPGRVRRPSTHEETIERVAIMARNLHRSRTSSRARSAFEERAHGRERVGLLVALVGPVALDAREAQRHAARVARARLELLVGDLDDQLGAYVHDVAVAAELARAELAGLPLEQSVAHA